MRKTLILFFSFLFLIQAAVSGETIKLAAPAFLPFNGTPGGNSEGYMVEVFREIFEKKGFKINYELMPKRRTYFYMKTGKIDATLIIDKSSASEFIYPVETFGFVSDTFFTRKDSTWRFVGTDSLKDINIGGFAGYPYGFQIKRYIRNNKNVELLTGVKTIERNLMKLLYGRIDVLISTPQVIRWIRSKKFFPSGIERRGTIGTEKMIHIAFSPSNKNSAMYSEMFSEGINSLRKSGRFQKILDKYNQKDWKASLKKSLKKDLVIGQVGKAQTLDPAMATDLYSFEVINNFLEGLVKYRDDSTDIEPCLAKSWDISKDKTTWIFNLRDDVRFHDGTKFKSYSVVKNFRRQIDKNNRYYRKNYAYADIAFANVKEVKAKGDYRVMIKLSNPYAPFIYNLAMPAAKIISPESLKKIDISGSGPAGTGPFKFSSWKNNGIVLKRNNNYWGDKAYINSVQFRAMESKKILSSFKKGETSIMCDFTPESALKIVNLQEVKLLLSPVMHVSYIAFNTEKKPVNSVKMRYALNHALQKKKLVENLYKGFAVVSKTAIPPSMWAHNESIKDFKYDEVKAKEIIKKMGLKKTKLKFWIMDRPVNKLTALRVFYDFKKVGVDVEIVTKKAGDFYRGVKRGEHDLALLDWYGDNGDPDNFLYVLFDKNNTVKGKASNRSFLKDEMLHRILVKAQKLQDKDKRNRLYRKAQERIKELAPWIHLYHKQMLVWCHKKVHGVVVHPTGSILLHKSWIE